MKGLRHGWDVGRGDGRGDGRKKKLVVVMGVQGVGKKGKGEATPGISVPFPPAVVLRL